MRRTVILVISSLFCYCLFRHMTLVTTVMLVAAMACAYAVSVIPSKYLLGAKYPLVGLSLLLSPALIVYPWLESSLMIAAAAVLFGFYAIALFLVTTEEKGRRVSKEVTGLSLLWAASSLNLFLTGHPEIILPLSVSVVLFLFIINRVRIMPFIAGYAAAATVFLAVKGVAMLGPALAMHDAVRYVLLACAFALLLITFAAFLKRSDLVSVLAFFGLLYVSCDLLMSLGFRLKGVLLYQPVLALFIMGPLVGMAMKGGKERL